MRLDNGPEFIAVAEADWCRFNSVCTIFINPDSSWLNAWIESFNRRLHEEFLNGWHLDYLIEAEVLIEAWCIDHMLNRPDSADGELISNEFAKVWITGKQTVHANRTAEPGPIMRCHTFGAGPIPDPYLGVHG